MQTLGAVLIAVAIVGLVIVAVMTGPARGSPADLAARAFRWCRATLGRR